MVVTVRTEGEEEEEEEGKKGGHAGEGKKKEEKAKELAKSTFHLPSVNSLLIHVASTN